MYHYNFSKVFLTFSDGGSTITYQVWNTKVKVSVSFKIQTLNKLHRAGCKFTSHNTQWISTIISRRIDEHRVESNHYILIKPCLFFAQWFVTLFVTWMSHLKEYLGVGCRRQKESGFFLSFFCVSESAFLVFLLHLPTTIHFSTS